MTEISVLDLLKGKIAKSIVRLARIAIATQCGSSHRNTI